jgi:hypothetical protein
MFNDEIDGPLSKQLDASGDLLPLLTKGEARAARYALWLFGQSDDAPSEAAHELALRLERRFRLAFPDESVALPDYDDQQFGVL